ncbi:MAG: ATP-dependent DNA ligase [Nocardioides sp.]
MFNTLMLLLDVVRVSAAVAATRSRKAKVAAIAELLARARDDAADMETVVAYVGGSLRQRRTGLGGRGLSALPQPAATATLTVAGVDSAFELLAAMAGAGSQAARSEAVALLFGAATAEEQPWLRRLVTGEVRQGASDALVQEAIASVAGVPLASVRRAAMLAGSTLPVVQAAFQGGASALDEIRLEVGRPVLPMLASSAKTVAEALAKVGGNGVIDTKLDGIRIQVHRSDEEVLVVTRSLDDITDRLPEVVTLARGLAAESFVLDGEALALGPDGRPRPFQETASRTGSHGTSEVAVTPYFFDVLHLDGRDLLDSPAHERAAALEALVPESNRVAQLVTSDADEAERFAAAAIAAGHEGVVVKDPSAPYAAGRRGGAWVKVKPVHTLDLVVLAVEWGSGRRKTWLSNLHLGARDPARPGDFVMLGKTFKGLSDEMLAWQTERFLELETHRQGPVVFVRPEQVVEIAIDGVQRSSRYPGGVALRFARVVRYRDDKGADSADVLSTVQSFLTASAETTPPTPS